MHRHPTSSSSSSSTLFKLLLLILICVIITFSVAFMWCYTDRMALSTEVSKLRKENKNTISELLNQKQKQENHNVDDDSEKIVEKKKIIVNNNNHHDDETEEQKQRLPRAITQMKYRVVVFTYLRPEGLKRLLNSLKNSYYPTGATVSLNILLDFPKPNAMKGEHAMDNKQARQDTLELINNFKWNHGPFIIHRRQANVGLKRNILESWYPSSSSFSSSSSTTTDDRNNNEVSILLEDDIEVSPFWFDWATASVERYYFQQVVEKHNSRILGVSLYRPIHDEQSHRKCTVDSHGAPYLLQQPCSWGAIYFPQQWKQFRDWYDEFNEVTNGEGDPLVITEQHEQPDANSWARTSSWKKYLIKFMHENGWGMVYPNLPDKLVYSTNHLMKGEHPTPNRKLFELPLLDAENAKKIWPSKSEVIDEMVAEISTCVANNNRNSKKYLSILMTDDEEKNSLPELEKLKSFDVMFNEEHGGAEKLLQPKKNLAQTGGEGLGKNGFGGNKRSGHHHHAGGGGNRY